MLYVDSSALMKHYVNELGSAGFEKRLIETSSNSMPIFTSLITFAEMHAAFARRTREKLFSLKEFRQIREQFDLEWASSLSPVEIKSDILTIVRDIVEGHQLKAADALHLATAIWLRDRAGHGTSTVFATADKQLATAAAKNAFVVFNPEVNP